MSRNTGLHTAQSQSTWGPYHATSSGERVFSWPAAWHDTSQARQLSRRDLSYSQQMKHVLSQFEDYPAIIPGERGKALLGRELTVEENSVRGTLVAGLTADDITFLDVFEGYARI